MNKQIVRALLTTAMSTLRMDDVHGHTAPWHSRYICDNLDRAVQDLASRRTMESLRKVIEERLGDALGVEEWLVGQGHVRDEAELRTEEMFQQVQLYRQRWMAALMEEFGS